MTPQAEARAARPSEAEAVLHTIAAAFGLDADAARPIFYGDPYYDLSHKRVLSLPEAGIVSCLTVVPTLVRVGGVPVPAGGVAGVATRPKHQRRGYAAALLEATVPALWTDLGYPISLLHPISAPFYRRFGWETASTVSNWHHAPAALPRHGEAVQVRPALESDWPAICRLHEAVTQTDTGACVRDARRWALIHLPIPGRETHVFDGADGLHGYIICERGDVLTILEMYAQTPAARRGLTGWLANQLESLASWQTSLHQLTDFNLPLPDCPPEPDAMLRIIDLEAALTAVHPTLFAPILTETGSSLTLQAIDPLVSRNERPLRLTPDGVVPATDSASSLRADIRILAQLYFGDISPGEVYADGSLTVDTPQTLALAERLFPRRSPYIAPLDQS